MSRRLIALWLLLAFPAIAQAQLITGPSTGGSSTSSVSDVNGVTGTVTIAGTASQVNVNTAGQTITLSTPQDIGTNSNLTFASIRLTNVAAGSGFASCLHTNANGIITVASGDCGVGSAGTVTTTGSPASPQVSFFSGATAITGSSSFTYNNSIGQLTATSFSTSGSGPGILDLLEGATPAVSAAGHAVIYPDATLHLTWLSQNTGAYASLVTANGSWNFASLSASNLTAGCLQASGNGVITSVGAACGTPGVTSVNALAGALTLASGTGINIVTTGGNTFTVNQATANIRRTVCMVAGSDDASASLTAVNIGPQSRQFFTPAAGTIVEVTVGGDAGTSAGLPAKRTSSNTVINLLSSPIATNAVGVTNCANTGGTTGLNASTTCLNTLTTTALEAGSWIEMASGTVAGNTKTFSTCVTWTVN